jgi:ribosomal protein S27E
MNTMGEMLVQLRGLERNAELNGKHANMLDYDSKNDRFIVSIDGEKVKVKPANIKMVDALLEQRERIFHIGAPPPTNTSKKHPRVRPKPKEKKEECSICMEELSGEVTLKCGHRMCPSCFAQHSRVSNTCPYCRDEFAPERGGKSEISPTLANTMIIETVRDYYHNEEMEEELNGFIEALLENDIPINRANLKASIYANMDGVCREMLEETVEWYEENM